MSNEFDVIVAGGGIAGLTAGLTAARLGRTTMVLTGDQLGGNLLSIEKIEGYPGFPDGVAGFELCPITQGQAAEAGAEFEATEILKLEGAAPNWKITTGEGDYSARAVILATGTSLKTLDVPGEEKLKGKGVSHCASCDAPMLRGKVVCVVGGGDSAMQEALTLAEHVERVIMLERGPALGGQASYRARIEENAKIEVRPNTTVAEILGESGVSGVKLASGETIEAEAVFIYVGLAPNVGYLDAGLARDAHGTIETDAAMHTALPGLFAAGSLRAGWGGRAVSAAGDGVTAAIEADRYLSENA